PLMIKVLKIPLRITIGTSLGIIFISAILGALGKIMSFQVNYFFVLPIVIGSLISAPFGAIVSKRVPQKIIKISLLIIIFLSFIQALFKVISIYR
ncbi:MAG TPA: sulfite exporter TauE/SafE family protein, partial [bacterium]|nr:sulfite exporter TauE/SafE family protein [bacterium]